MPHSDRQRSFELTSILATKPSFGGQPVEGPQSTDITRCIGRDSSIRLHLDSTLPVRFKGLETLYITRFTCDDGKGFALSRRSSTVDAVVMRSFSPDQSYQVHPQGQRSVAEAPDLIYAHVGDAWEESYAAAERDSAASAKEETTTPCSLQSNQDLCLKEIIEYVGGVTCHTLQGLQLASLPARAALASVGARDVTHRFHPLLQQLREADNLLVCLTEQSAAVESTISAVISRFISLAEQTLQSIEHVDTSCLTGEYILNETSRRYMHRLTAATFRELASQLHLVGHESASTLVSGSDYHTAALERTQKVLQDDTLWEYVRAFESRNRSSIILNSAQARSDMQQALTLSDPAQRCRKLSEILTCSLQSEALPLRIDRTHDFLSQLRLVCFQRGFLEPQPTVWEQFSQAALRSYKQDSSEPWRGTSRVWPAQTLRELFERHNGRLVVAFDTSLQTHLWLLDLAGGSDNPFVSDKIPLLREHGLEFEGSGYTLLAVSSFEGTKLAVKAARADLYKLATETLKDRAILNGERDCLSLCRIDTSTTGGNTASLDHQRVGWQALPVVVESGGTASQVQRLPIWPKWTDPE